MNHSQPRTSAVLRSPVFWGGLVYTIFHILWSQGVIKSGFVLRYCAGHPVEYVETALFLVGMAVPGDQALDVFGRGSVATPLQRPSLPGGTPVTEATCLLADLEDLPEGGGNICWFAVSALHCSTLSVRTPRKSSTRN